MVNVCAGLPDPRKPGGSLWMVGRVQRSQQVGQLEAHWIQGYMYIYIYITCIATFGQRPDGDKQVSQTDHIQKNVLSDLTISAWNFVKGYLVEKIMAHHFCIKALTEVLISLKWPK